MPTEAGVIVLFPVKAKERAEEDHVPIPQKGKAKANIEAAPLERVEVVKVAFVNFMLEALLIWAINVGIAMETKLLLLPQLKGPWLAKRPKLLRRTSNLKPKRKLSLELAIPPSYSPPWLPLLMPLLLLLRTKCRCLSTLRNCLKSARFMQTS